MTQPHFPGAEVVRQWDVSQYSEWQNSLWLTLDDVYFAAVGGYTETRHPSPSLVVEGERFAAWQQRVIDRWEYEATTRDNRTRGLTKADLPDCTWLYMYERMLAAEPLRPPVVPPEQFRFYMGSWVGTPVGSGTVTGRTAGEPNRYGVQMGGQVVQFTEGELNYLDDD